MISAQDNIVDNNNNNRTLKVRKVSKSVSEFIGDVWHRFLVYWFVFFLLQFIELFRNLILDTT